MKIIRNYYRYFDLHEASSPFQQMKTIYAFKDSQMIFSITLILNSRILNSGFHNHPQSF